MWLAWLALALGLTAVLLGGWSVDTAYAGYVALLVIVLLESAARALRGHVTGDLSDRDLGWHAAAMACAVLVVAWVGEQLSVGRVGSVPSVTLALEVALAFRILAHVDALRAALSRPPAVPSPHESYGPPGSRGSAERAGRRS